MPPVTPPGVVCDARYAVSCPETSRAHMPTAHKQSTYHHSKAKAAAINPPVTAHPLPWPQIAYLTILSAGYYLYSTHFFAVLPNDTAAGYHV